MAKIVGTVQRLAALTHAAFRDYYEANHAPLALQYMPFTRYARSYLVNPEGMDFDVIPEFWLDDVASVGSVLSGPAGQILAEDEAKFFYRDRMAAAPVDEFILARPSIEPGSTRRRKALLLRAESRVRDKIRGAGFDWASSFTKPGREVVLDFVTALSQPEFPADMVVWIEPSIDPPAPEGPLSLWKVLEVETCETAADKLVAAAA
jgi:hypothetical protein